MHDASKNPGRFKESLLRLRSTRVMVTCAMLLAVQVLLGYVGSFVINTYLRVSFGFLAVAVVAYLFGPVPAMINAALADVLLWVVKPMGAFYLGFTISAVLGGLIYALFFYRREIGLVRIAFAKLTVDILINIGLNTLWLWHMQGQAIRVMLPTRALKNLAQYPLDVGLLMLLMPTIIRVAGHLAPTPQPRRIRGLALAGALVLWIGACLWLNNTSLWEMDRGDPLLLAHRGVHQTFDIEGVQWDTDTSKIIYPPEHDYMENTLRSMDEAFRLGASVVELDVHRTKDDQLAVFHDYLLDYRTDAQGPVSDYTMDQLRTLDVGYGYTADGGASYPFRGQGVGLMPELREVLARFPDKDLLIHIKDGDLVAAGILADYLADMDEQRLAHVQCYGGAEEMALLQERIPALRTMSMDSLKRALLQYMALGWSGVVPESIRDTQIHLPVEYTRFLWGWPKKFMKRMGEANTRVVLVRGGGGASQGFDDIESLQAIPEGFDGYIWTNRIDRLSGDWKEMAP